MLEDKNKLIATLISYGLNGTDNKYDIEKIFLKNYDYKKRYRTTSVSLINPNTNDRDITISYSKNTNTHRIKNNSYVTISSIL